MKECVKILGIILLWCVSVAAANVELTYELDSAQLKAIRLAQVSDGTYYVTVELNDHYKRIFAEFTKANIGKEIIIMHHGRILLSSKVKDVITSGAIVIKTATPQEGTSIIKDILLSN